MHNVELAEGMTTNIYGIQITSHPRSGVTRRYIDTVPAASECDVHRSTRESNVPPQLSETCTFAQPKEYGKRQTKRALPIG